MSAPGIRFSPLRVCWCCCWFSTFPELILSSLCFTSHVATEVFSRLAQWQPIIRQSEMKPLSRVRLFATPWTAAYQAPPSVGFSRQEHWSGWHFPLQALDKSSLKILEPLHLPVFAEGPADCPHCSVWDSATNLCLNSCASDFHIYFSTLGLLFIPPVKELFWKSLFLLKVLAKQPYIA